MKKISNGFDIGFASACALFMSLNDDINAVSEVFTANFMSIEKMQKIGVPDFDIKILSPVVEKIEHKRKCQNIVPLK